MLPFRDRREAGRLLAEALKALKPPADSWVLALPRGGVPVAYEIAQALALPLAAWPVRKLGAPGQEELALGAVSLETVYLNDALIRQLALPQAALEPHIARARQELTRQAAHYRQDAPLALRGKTAIVVDDGAATGASLIAACQALKPLAPAQLIAAVPVCPPDTLAALQACFDAVVCLATPEPFIAVGRWYRDFAQVSDEEVATLLASQTG